MSSLELCIVVDFYGYVLMRLVCFLPFIQELRGVMGWNSYLLTFDHFVAFHWGQEPALQLTEFCGFVLGSHLTVPALQVTERCLNPSPQVTEH